MKTDEDHQLQSRPPAILPITFPSRALFGFEWKTSGARGLAREARF